jgi:thymidylate synthase (FAD)
MRNRHTSPFEAVVMTFEVKAPIFVFRQWHRHRTWSYNELSARYRELPHEFYVPDPDTIGTQSKSNKQMRDVDKRHPHAMSVAHEIMNIQDECYDKYKQLLDADVPRELARSVLPVSIYSNMFATVDLHNLFHFMELRLHEHAQYEIRKYAEALLGLAYLVAPVSVTAFREFRLSQES